MISGRLQEDLKQAMLARDSFRVELLRGLKSAILYAEVASGNREKGLTDDEIIQVLKKEAKKRQEAADLYEKAGNTEKFNQESKEFEIISDYLPEQLDEGAIAKVLDLVMQELSIETPQKQDMGKLINAIKQKTGASADGSMIAKVVNSKIK